MTLDRRSTQEGIEHGFPNRAGAKHLFIAGTSGQGKTTANINLMLQLHEQGIPFLVLEPVKTEYRELKKLKNHPDERVRNLAKDLEIYTPGKETISPLRFNPLAVPRGITTEEHIELSMENVRAALPLSGPLPALIREGLEEVHEDHPDRENPPTMSDGVAAVKDVCSRKQYSAETLADIQTALEVRLEQLIRGTAGKVFQCQSSHPDVEHLMNSCSVIELPYYNREPDCLLCLFLFTAIREYLRSQPYPDDKLRFMLFIEEAHNLIGRSAESTASENNADPKAFASEYVLRMLAELRAYGVGVVITTPVPSRVTPEVIKNTGTKLIFRIVAEDDRAELGGAMLFGPTEMQELARLEPGEAFFYTEGYHGPRRIRTENLHKKLGLGKPPMNEELLPHIQEEEWFIRARTARRAEELEQLGQRMKRFDFLRVELTGKVCNLMTRYPKILARCESSEKSARLDRLARQVRLLHRQLSNAYVGFVALSYRRLLGAGENGSVVCGEIAELYRNLKHRFEAVVRPGTESALETLEKFIERCSADL